MVDTGCWTKSKCIFMCGPQTRRYADPKPLKLYGKDLPWVSHATHLGHELSKDGTMELDANMKRGQFISNSMDIRSMFSFALPDQILKAVYIVVIFMGQCYGIYMVNEQVKSSEAGTHVLS